MIDFFLFSFATALITLLLERNFKWPQWIENKTGHPIKWIGILIEKMENIWNQHPKKKDAKQKGAMMMLILIMASALCLIPISIFLKTFYWGWIIEVLIAWPFIAQNSLETHVRNVKNALDISLDNARGELAHIVGRETKNLNETQITSAAIESLAENTSDAVTAPILWFIIAGLPGLIIYKIINTADSMIAHKSPKYIYFGYVAAKIDDIVNWPAARLTALFFTITGWSKYNAKIKKIVQITQKCAPNHRSPNAGWPEAAIAAIMNIQLGGKRTYQGKNITLANMGEGRKKLNREDIKKALNIYQDTLNMIYLFVAGPIVILALCALS